MSEPRPAGRSELEERFTRFLSERGLKLTGERRRLLGLLRLLPGDGSLAAERLVQRAAREHPPISRATVYRTLDLWVKGGLVRPVGRDPGRYEVIAGRPQPVRLVCLRCGSTLEADGEGLRRERDRLARGLGFEPLHHHVEIFGTCRECARGRRSAPRRRPKAPGRRRR